MKGYTAKTKEQKRSINETIKWIHFSDLHMNSDRHMETEELRAQLLSFIHQNNIQCDYAFCTGDIRNGGQSYSGAKEYIKKLCAALNVPIENLYVVPGNHDVNRDLRSRRKAIKTISFYNPISGKHEGEYSSVKGVIEPNSLDKIYLGLKEFRDFIGDLYSEHDPNRIKYYEKPQNPHFVIQTNDFNILHIDSTITYMKNQERHELVIGTWPLWEALEDINDNLPTIVLSHFPIMSFTQDERNNILHLLRSRNICLWLCGHEHDHMLMHYANVYSVQAGELRSEGDGTNATVLFGEYNPAEGSGFVRAYTWFPGGWAIYPEQWSSLDSPFNSKTEDFFFGLKSAEKQRAFELNTKNNYESHVFKCNNPWDEKFTIRVISYNQGVLTWEWGNEIHLHTSGSDKVIEIREQLVTPLDESFVGKYEINHKEYCYDDPKAYFWYFYQGTIQLIDRKIIISFIYGQRMSFMLGGSGGKGYWYTGAWANADNRYSILQRDNK